MKIRCLIIDDEPLAVRLVNSYCQQMPELEVVATCSSAIEAYRILQQHRIDLLFLDIKMPQLLGTDFIRGLTNPPKVILITAYRKYALDGYDLDIIDYVLKPLSFSRFMKAVSKAGRLLAIDAQVSKPTAEHNEHEDAFLYFKIDKEMIKIHLNDILFIESCKEYVKLHMEGKRPLLVKQSISSMEKLLSPHRFLRVHRSYMVTIERVQSYSATHLRIGESSIPIGRFYKNNVDQFIKH
jgi:DNA-binding LytR/AlgR family response regulator